MLNKGLSVLTLSRFPRWATKILIMLLARAIVLPEGRNIIRRIWSLIQPERFLAAEIDSKKVCYPREEIPYSIAVVIEQMKIREEKAIIDIDATIYVERPSQKGMRSGNPGPYSNGSALARKEIETLLGSQGVSYPVGQSAAKWRMDEHDLRMFGYDRHNTGGVFISCTSSRNLISILTSKNFL